MTTDYETMQKPTREEARKRLEQLQDMELRYQANVRELRGTLEVLDGEELVSFAIDFAAQAKEAETSAESDMMIVALMAHVMKRRVPHGEYGELTDKVAKESGCHSGTLRNYKSIYERLPERHWATAWDIGARKSLIALSAPEKMWPRLWEGVFIVPPARDWGCAMQRDITNVTTRELQRVVDQWRGINATKGGDSAPPTDSKPSETVSKKRQDGESTNEDVQQLHRIYRQRFEQLEKRLDKKVKAGAKAKALIHRKNEMIERQHRKIQQQKKMIENQKDTIRRLEQRMAGLETSQEQVEESQIFARRT